MTPWSELDPDTQLQLREEYGRDPACQTGTCSMDAKIAQFSNWLSQRGILFGPSDLNKSRK